MKGRLKDLTFSREGKQIVSIELADDFRGIWDELNGSDIDLDVKKYRKRRSLDANGYFWVLVGKLSEKTRQNKTDIYRHLIREIGGNYEMLPIKDAAVEKFCEAWQRNGMGWICDIVGKSKVDGYTNICAYYGSSTYDTAQMTRLIDSVVIECKEQGIPTETPEEISKLLSLWAAEPQKGKLCSTK